MILVLFIVILTTFGQGNAIMSLTETQAKMTKWIESQAKGEKSNLDVYGKPTTKQIKELENVRNLSRELQDNLNELENYVRISDVENSAMNPTAPPPDTSEVHEFMGERTDCYAEEDFKEAREEEKRQLTKGTKTEIQAFFEGQSLFLTGGTGFLGKVLIEKLLRACPGIETIYVLIRSKKGKDATSRLHDMMDDFLFTKAHEINPKGIHKLVAINGDMELPGLGINETDWKMLTTKVSIIINAAATVKFDEKLSVAAKINVKGSKEVVRLARACRHLTAFTHVSTAFSHCYNNNIDEKFYKPPLTVEALEAITEIGDTVLDDITPKLLGDYPNTYCFTKAVAEEVVRKYGEGIPVCIVRPAIVVSTYEEPVRGWTDSVYGPTGIMIGIGTGVLRTMYMDVEKVADMVPVDLTVNAILASAWHTAKNYKENQTSNIPIYNYVSGPQNPLKWRQFIELNRKYGIDKPTTKAVWYYGLNPTKYYHLFLFLNFFLHYIPALLVDGFLTLTGKRRVMLHLYNKVMKLAHILFYFSMQEWKFKNDGVQNMWKSLSEADKAVFPFNIGDMSWEYHSETFIVGLRVYLVKDDLSTLPDARKKWNRLFYMHQLLKIITFGLLPYLVFVYLKSFW